MNNVKMPYNMKINLKNRKFVKVYLNATSRFFDQREEELIIPE